MTMYDPIMDLDIPKVKDDWRWKEGYAVGQQTGFEVGVREGISQTKEKYFVTNDDRVCMLLEIIKYKCGEKFYDVVLNELEKLNEKMKQMIYKTLQTQM